MRRVTAWVVAAAVTAAATPAAQAQRYSEGYRFLEAVRKADGAELTKILNEPGTRVVNTRADNGEGALHIVARRSDETYLRFLLARGADRNLRDRQGDTPMMTAVLANFQPGLELLLRLKADPNIANNAGETPLIRAVQMRNLEAARLLLANGANPDQTDNVAGMSARDYAARDTRLPALGKLLADAPKVEARRAMAGPKL